MAGPYASTESLAEYFDVSVSTIRQWVKGGKIPESTYIKVGTTYRFHVQAVEKALLNFDGGMTQQERDAEADRILHDVDPQDSSEVDEELEAKVKGVPYVPSNPDIDDEINAILDETETGEDRDL